MMDRQPDTPLNVPSNTKVENGKGDLLHFIPENWRYGIIVVLVIVAIAVLAKWAVGASSSSGGGAGNMSPTLSDCSGGQALIEQASRWQAISMQDQNPALRLVHASFAVAYANAARAICADDKLRAAIGVNIQEFSMDVDKNQRNAFQTISHMCPGTQPTNDYAVMTGWLA